MSAREMVGPEMAFDHSMKSMDHRLGIVERRSMWPGATQQASQIPETTMTIQDSGDPAYPDIALATFGCDLALDPGRWVLLARMYGSIFIDTGSGRSIGMFLQADGSDGVQTRETHSMSGTATGTTELALTLAMEIISTTPIGVSVLGFAGAPPGYLFGVAYLYLADIVAFPG